MAYSIVVAGNDITNNCDQMTIDIQDTLGQGAGAGGTSQGRATTFAVMTNLGPVSAAGGAGNPGSSKLVRQGEITVTDQNGNRVFGGYVSKLTDSTMYMTNLAKLEAIDYSTSLQRVTVNKTYSAQSDAFILKDLLTTYTTGFDLSGLPNAAAYVFPVLLLRNITLEAAIQKLASITGFQFWIDFKKKAFYQPPSLNTTAPFSLSDSPDFSSSFPHYVEEYFIDDNAIINRVTFYGGKLLSKDTLQDVSPLANGSNTLFPAAWYMRGMAADNLIHVYVNGVDQQPYVGNLIAAANDPGNLLRSQGGICTCVVNSDARTVQFDVGGTLTVNGISTPCGYWNGTSFGTTVPLAGATVLIGYRYEYPLTTVVVDNTSHALFGTWLDGSATDETVFDTTTAVQRCKVILRQMSMGNTSIKVHCWKPGVQAGETIKLVNSVRGINGTYVVQAVDTVPLGGGNFDYVLTLGAWNWNVVDIILKLGLAASPTDTLQSITNDVDIQQATHRTVTTVTSAAAISHVHGGNLLSADYPATPSSPSASIGLFVLTS
jgi:hypothetical protein